ncbi:MAG: rhodanese-like domain-containing protein [Fimbriiglobus sp.]|jgi:rhodanese-related sulfurtransferase|nr:rhodanese-like domain-containing protein [Fimbriiglobus sp.]
MPRFNWILPAILTATCAACAADHTADTLDVVKKGVADKKAMLVDVREENEWTSGHLKDATLLPLSELKAGVTADKLKEKLGDTKVLYLHCGSGKRCLTAADLLKKQGYDVRPLKEGYADLVKAGFEKAK